MSSPPPPPTSILLLGATGELGSSVLHALLSQTHGQTPSITLIAVLRPPSPTSTTPHSTLTHLSTLPITLLHLDITTLPTSSLTTLFHPHHTIISCLGFSAPPGTQLRITQAALAARVPRYFPWQFGVDYDVLGAGSAQDLFDEQLAVRALLRARAAESGVGWVIVSTGVFMSFVLEPAFGVVEGLALRGTEGEGEGGTDDGVDDDDGGKEGFDAAAAARAAGGAPRIVTVRALGAWHHGLTTTCVEDIGRLTAAIVLDASVDCVIVRLAGETLTYAQLAALIERRFGPGEVQRELWTQEALEEALKRAPGDAMAKYRVAFAANRGVVWPVRETYHARRGMAMMGLEEWMERNVRV